METTMPTWDLCAGVLQHVATERLYVLLDMSTKWNYLPVVQGLISNCLQHGSNDDRARVTFVIRCDKGPGNALQKIVPTGRGQLYMKLVIGVRRRGRPQSG